MRRVVLWFKNDLRLHDNYVVDQAKLLLSSGNFDEVVPVYCFDPRHFGFTKYGNPKTGNYRAQFLLESILDLKSSLQGVGSDLLVKIGHPEDILPHLLGKKGGKILTQEEIASEELRVLAKVRRAAGGSALELVWDGTLHHRDDLPFSKDLNNMPDVFTPFRNKVESRCQPRKLTARVQNGQLPLPTDATKEEWGFCPAKVEELQPVVPQGGPLLASPEIHKQVALKFKGGEREALRRVHYYLWEADLLGDYFNTRNGMLGGDYSTKLSPWLAHGCVSPRYIFHEIVKYEEQRKKNKSTYWVTFELLWRDFFRFFLLKHGNAVFFEGGTMGKQQQWNSDQQLFERWRDGQTGMPLVDANMRELKSTGFMSNRGRQNVASYLILDLGIDWRKGGDWFESVLSDYDVASNWGNWVAAAGLTGGRVNHFNIVKQSKDYDKDGEYVKAWIPELARVPAQKVHEPWTLTKEEQENAGVQIGKDYPYPTKSVYSREEEGRGPGKRNPRMAGSRGGGRQRHQKGGRPNKLSEFDRFG